MVYWNSQEVVQAVIGGALIALSTTLNLLLFGRITGISGILSSVTKYDTSQGFYWKYCFILGLLTIPKILQVIFGSYIDLGDGYYFPMFDSNELAMKQTHIAAWFIGGFLVGVGVRMGNGCTSGHGVCGIPRLATRSIVATCTFMITGFALASLKYHEPFLSNGETFGDTYYEVWRWLTLAILILGHIYGGFVLISKDEKHIRLECIWSYVFGLLFGLGLLISGMCRISKILNFLIIDSVVWDPTLIFVMGSAVAINVVTFYFIQKRKYPIYGEKFSIPPRKGKVDLRLVCGAAIFGIGWGFAGLCPGPGLVNFFHETHGLFWVLSLFIGMFTFDYGLKFYEDKKKKTEVTYVRTN
ncbi:UNKNOWN [Stylonychia lemnae]|uniref:Uncharacterized protein n=1 Tax=Stylonychia lemnae TaxID=5949 RepID=A0A077ZUE5_STYLE|nr:UNKNOWN [Stylonychia lemnae]|eukprot:CDW73492.1 UNKNOWN [Stylonychia lemnae]